MAVTSDRRHEWRKSLTRCANCEAALTGTWCAHCGQKKSPPDPTWHDLTHEAVHEFLHVDGKILRTARKLFFQPGELTAEHIRGRRVRYVGAIRLYLTMSALFFILSAVIPNPNPNESSASTRESGVAESAQQAGGVVRESARSWRARLARGMRLAAEREDSFQEMLSHAFPRMMFLLLPIFAVLARWIYRDRNRRYPQFLYFALHFHAAAFGFLILTLPLQSLQYETWLTLAQALVIAGSLVYLMVALKTVFGGSTAQTMRRASALAIAYGVVYLVAIAITILISFYRLGAA